MSVARTGQTIGPVERLLHFKRSSALGGLGAGELAVIAEHAVERRFRKGEALLREGEPAGALHVVVDGKVHVARRGQVLGHGGPGAVAGGFAIFARDPEGIEAIAEADTLTLEIDADTLNEIFEDHFAILHHVLRLVCRQLRQSFEQRPGEMQRSLPAVRPAEQAPRELDYVQRIFYLRRVPVFARCSINALSELSRGLTEMTWEPGTPLWRHGDPSGTVLLLVSGLALCTTPGGVVFVAGGGSPLGAIDSLAEEPRFFDVMAETRLVALQGTVESIVDVFEDNFEMAMDCLAVMARTLLGVHERGSSLDSGAIYGCDTSPD
jgi:CRP-like cAMP-binding protein